MREADPDSGTSSYVTSIPIGGHRAVTLNAAKELIYADNTNPAHLGKILGISESAADAGSLLTVCSFGELIESSWTWTLDGPIYLTTNGQLTQTAPTTGFLCAVGFPISSTAIFVGVQPSIILI